MLARAVLLALCLALASGLGERTGAACGCSGAHHSA